jgi:hypothetical protein
VHLYKNQLQSFELLWSQENNDEFMNP